MKKMLLFAFVAALLLIPAAAFADNPLDTAVGTVITADGSAATMNYTDSSLSSKATVYASTIETVVAAMYGFDPLANLPGTGSDVTATTPVIPVTYMYVITNEGNASDNYMVRYYTSLGGPSSFISGSGAGWNVMITEDADSTVYNSQTGNFTPGFVTGWATLQAISEDANRKVYITVTPSTSQVQSPNDAWMNVTIEAYTSKTPAGVYIGANAVTYGGTFDATDMTITSIETSVMDMTRVATVDAPKTASGKYTGGYHDAVPGAIITYTIITSNDGSSNANNVVIVDKVPANTLAAHVGATGTAVNSYVNITVPSGNAVGWTAYYSTVASPSRTWESISGWTTIGATPISKELTVEAGTGATSNVTYVRFDKATVTPAEKAQTLTWGVTIR